METDELGSPYQMCTGQNLNQKEARTVDDPREGGSFTHRAVSRAATATVQASKSGVLESRNRVLT